MMSRSDQQKTVAIDRGVTRIDGPADVIEKLGKMVVAFYDHQPRIWAMNRTARRQERVSQIGARSIENDGGVAKLGRDGIGHPGLADLRWAAQHDTALVVVSLRNVAHGMTAEPG